MRAICELLRPFRSQKVQLITDDNNRVMLQECGRKWESIVFNVEQAFNHQNSAIVQQRQNPQSVMVRAVHSSGSSSCFHLHFGVTSDALRFEWFLISYCLLTI